MVRRYNVFYYLCPSCEEFQIVADLSNEPHEVADYSCTECETLFSSWEVRDKPSPIGGNNE